MPIILIAGDKVSDLFRSVLHYLFICLFLQSAKQVTYMHDIIVDFAVVVKFISQSHCNLVTQAL